ncbi:MAG: SRPBCC family protein [Deltaproteobacteria bacterium]|nr:SRPBCC family protein [Deltaproteobacteria bacterium]
MSFVAEVQKVVQIPPAACFARLADFPSWTRWMPASFRPVDGPNRPLALGDALRVHIRGVPGKTRLHIATFEPGRTLAWRGGVGGVLQALHAFRFEPEGQGTRIISSELWSGVLARGPIAKQVRRDAERVGHEQVDALIGDLQAHPT